MLKDGAVAARQLDGMNGRRMQYLYPFIQSPYLYALDSSITVRHAKMEPLHILLHELENKIPLLHKQNPAVSDASVAWHIEHTILAAGKMADAVAHSNPDDYRWQFNWRRLMVFTTGRIPRGKAKAPKTVIPQSIADAATLAAHLTSLRNKLHHLSMVQPHHFFVHPYFGPLHVKHTQKAIYIHTQHHLKIINDIIAYR
jgi:hypothetical protein